MPRPTQQGVVQHRIAALVALLVAATLPARAQTVSTCSFGGPTPGHRVARVDLAERTDFLSIELLGGRTPRVAAEESWHLVQGLYVLNAETLALEAFRIETIGVGPRRITVAADGAAIAAQPVPKPDGPFVHAAARPRAGLPAGSYYLIGFGSDGSPAFPNDWWGADVRIGGDHQCIATGSGDVFDYDHTQFSGGTQVYAQPAGIADEIALTFETARQVVVGVMDASVQLAGDAQLDYDMPSAAGIVNDEIQPFVSTGGTFRFEGRFTGLYPTLLVAGAAIDP